MFVASLLALVIYTGAFSGKLVLDAINQPNTLNFAAAGALVAITIFTSVAAALVLARK